MDEGNSTPFFNLTFSTSSKEYLLYSSRDQVTGQSLAVGLVMMVAILGNCTMMLAVWRTPHLRTLTNIFTINLAITDMCVALLVLPCWISSFVLGASSSEPPFPHGLCQLMAFLTVLLLLVSIATLSGISLDRYLCICHPLRYPLEVTTRKVYLGLFYIWLQSIVLASAPFYGWGKYKWRPQSIPICNPVWVEDASYSAFILVVGIVIPFSIMLFSYIRIVQEARRQACRIQQIQLTLIVPPRTSPRTTDRRASSVNHVDFLDPENGADEDHEVGEMEVMDVQRRPSFIQRMARRTSAMHSPIRNSYTTFTRNLKMLKTVFIVVGAFFLCWGPYVAINLWSVNVMTPSSDDGTVPYLADLFTTLLAFSNSALNPFVFIFLTRDFRLAVRMLLCRCLRRCPLTSNCNVAQRLRRNSRANSMVETIRLQSRGSYDSGVEMDNQSPLRKSPLLAKMQCTYENNGYDEGGGGENGHPHSPTHSLPNRARHQRFLGEDLFPPNEGMGQSLLDADANEVHLPSPEEQITIAVPVIPGQVPIQMN